MSSESDVNGFTNVAKAGSTGAVNAIPDGWESNHLKDLVEVRSSNVDKKSYEGHAPVKLCNYTDVYYNNQITNAIHFMEATAKEREIERFTLEYDDVIITKDSETPDDIAVPAHVNQQLSNVVCGYHLTLLRPDKVKSSGQFLSHLFQLPSVQHHFYILANGITRFGLTADAIKNAPLVTPPLPEQKKIAAILSSVDDVIEKTQAQINKLKALKTGMMQELLSPREGTGQPQGVGENGRGHTEFKDSPIGRIPVGWGVVTLENLLSDVEYSMRSGPFGSALLKSELVENGIPYLGIDNVHVERFENKFRRFVSNDKFQELVRYAVRENDVMVTIMGTVGRCCVVPKGVGKALSSKHVWTMTLDHEKYISELLCWQINYGTWVQDQFKNESQGGVMESISSKTLKKLLLPLPPKKEQIIISQVHAKITSTINKISNRLNSYKRLKKALMQDLLTGKVRVTVPSHPCDHGMSESIHVKTDN